MTPRVFACLLLVLIVAPLAAQTPKYGVTVVADKDTNFTALKTYTWEHGWQAYDKTVHAQITAAVDRELAALGFQKKESGPADVLVTYASLRRVDVDLKSKPTEGNGGRRQYDVGTLVVLLLQPDSRKELYRARADKPIEVDPAQTQGLIDGVVTEMFAKYPTRAAKGR
jgi:hypothetical protein